MNEDFRAAVRGICSKFERDRTRMMDIVQAVQRRFGCVSGDAMELIAEACGTHRVEVESLVSFYSFFSGKPSGKIVIRLCTDIIDRMYGMDQVLRAFERELGIKVGETTSDGRISLMETACIGMSDQAPAALVDEVVVTRLSTDSARNIVSELKRHGNPRRLVTKLGDGNNAHDLISAMVENNIRRRGPVIFEELKPGDAIEKALAMSPVEVIRSIKTSRLRGRGGAGFPTGMKWEYTRATKASKRIFICNADEGEPGTFKDRVILTERPDLVFEGMTIGGYATGATEGIVYLRAEYAYLKDFLEAVLQKRRDRGLLGHSVCGRTDFHFDIRIQMGAGAYICGEESALISSCEGLRGDPRNRPPFPAQRGYLGFPTSVNNVETLCCVARIVERGAPWFSQLGSPRSSGTKLLSVSGDCRRPGVYEVPLGIQLQEVLKMAGGDEAAAVQVGGPSGQMVGPSEFTRTICFDDLSTGGAIIVFGPERDLLEVVSAFLDFFKEESCGYCTPCRVGNVLLKNQITRIRAGVAEPSDLTVLKELAEMVKLGSRCGLGQSSPNPVLSTLAGFASLYDSLVSPRADGVKASFDLEASLGAFKRMTGPEPS